MEYLETYEHNHDEVEVDDDDVNCTIEDDVAKETSNVYYLTKLTTNEDVRTSSTFIFLM